MSIRITSSAAARALGIDDQTIRETGLTRGQRQDSPAERRLEAICSETFGERAVPQFKPLAHRRFQVDVGFPEERLAVECDGWSNHGRFLESFKRDRERDRALLVEGGWTVLRFYASEITEGSREYLVDTIRRALEHCQRGGMSTNE